MGMASTDLPLVAPDCGVSQAEGYHPKSSWPPGFRFHPTDEELVLYYLKRKVCRRRMKLNMIGEIDVYKCEPWELPEKSLLQTGDKQWFFFSPRDKKYPNGARANRGTKRGYWKATGKDRNISRNSRPVGVKKTLVFYDGRAPSGKRTNWVMHEYTMDEEELKTCNALQNSYAIYKIFRKSGSGPKNGEQYGAPFREEEWSDDDHTGDGLKNTESGEDTMGKDVRCPSLDDDLGGIEYWSSMGNIEEVLCQLTDDPGIEQPQQNAHVSEVNAEVAAECYSVDQLLEEALLAEGGAKLLHAYEVANGVQNADLSTPLMHPCELPEVSSTFYLSEHDYPQAIEGNYFESHDLLDPTKPCASGVENNVSEDLLLAEMEGLFEPEFFHDAPLSFSSVTVAHDRTAQLPNHLDSISEINSTRLDDLPLMDSIDSGNLYHHTSPFSTGELWIQNQNFNVFTSAESRHILVEPPASGTAYEGSSGNISQTRHQQQSNSVDPNGNEQGTQGVDSSSWFTSAVYSFLDRIPSHPAAASENTLINRALERMSSFGAIRIGAPDNRDVTAAASEITSPVVGRRRSDGNGGFFFISLIVLLWALLWVFIIGSAIKVFKAFTGRYISS